MVAFLAVSVLHGVVDCPFEVVRVGESLMRQLGLFKRFPGWLDVVEFRGVFWQPLNREPMGAVGKCGPGQFAGVNRAVVEHQNDWHVVLAQLWAVKPVDFGQQIDEIRGSLCAGCDNVQMIGCEVERAHHGDLFRLPRCRNAQVGPALRPCASQIRMGQRLAFIGKEQPDVFSLCLLFQ